MTSEQTARPDPARLAPRPPLQDDAPYDAQYEQARQNMIQQQIRTWDVLDPEVLELLALVPRERFVPAHLRSLAFVDFELPLNLDGVVTGETMLAPKVEARLLQELRIHRHETVLEIGTGSGYMAALAAHRAQTVWTVEIDARLRAFGAANLARAGVRNAHVEQGDGAQGWGAHAPYDAIIVSGGLPVVPAPMLQQLKVGGRLAAIVGRAPAMQAQIVTRSTADHFDTLTLFETVTRMLRNAAGPSAFRF
jgi:protein-L-isoaspartate(D-aspartate) O-methyltransferase